MSHYATIKTQIKNPKLLKAALEARGYKVEQHEKPVVLRGYQGGFTAEVVIRRRDAKAQWGDIGWKRGEDGNFSFVFDDLDLKRFDTDWQNAVNQEYAIQVGIEAQKEMGYEVMAREAQPDGSVRIVMQQATMY
ncbi:MAG: DUF1257 domain-containing protein [Acidobacteriota bacterium]